MIGNIKFRLLPGISYFMFTLLLLSGCIAENNDDCFKGVPLKVKLPAGISPETMKDMNIYVFDDNDLLLDILPAHSSEPVMLNYPGIPSLHCIAWGNTQDGTILVSPLRKGDPLSDGFISLKPSASTKAAQGIFTSPTDLFYGEFNVENTSTSNHIAEQEILVSRMVASMNITIRGLELLSQSNEGDYSIVVYETASRVDFEGRYGGESASCKFSPPFETGRDYVIPPFNLFPTTEGGGIAIDIYRNGSLLRKVTTDSGNRPFTPVVGKTLNVLLNFKLDADVQIEFTGWGEKYIWKNFN